MTTSRKTSTGNETFSPEELEAMQEAKRERKKGGKANGEADLLAKIAEMDGSDRDMAERIHAIVKEVAPQLAPKTWYGMPAWADGAGKAVCFFTPANKFKERYASFGFNANAQLDDGDMWPTSFALLRIGDAEEKRIAELVKQAAG
jgi:uncharacterized protein YdhG (YjbR/CyaY superfamily)